MKQHCYAGTFQQLVLTDSLSALVASPPLLYVTNARRFTDWRLVITAVTFQVKPLSRPECLFVQPHPLLAPTKQIGPCLSLRCVLQHLHEHVIKASVDKVPVCHSSSSSIQQCRYCSTPTVQNYIGTHTRTHKPAPPLS